MKLLAAAFYALALTDAFAQARPVKRYQRTEFSSGSASPPFVTTDTLTVGPDGRVSWRQVLRYFRPLALPAKFFEPGKRGQIVTEWGNDQPRDMWHNWSYTYLYDQRGRLTRFTYSSCFICSSQAYDYTVSYDARGRPARLINNNLYGSEEYRFAYKTDGTVARFEEYDRRKIRRRIYFLN